MFTKTAHRNTQTHIYTKTVMCPCGRRWIEVLNYSFRMALIGACVPVCVRVRMSICLVCVSLLGLLMWEHKSAQHTSNLDVGLSDQHPKYSPQQTRTHTTKIITIHSRRFYSHTDSYLHSVCMTNKLEVNFKSPSIKSSICSPNLQNCLCLLNVIFFTTTNRNSFIDVDNQWEIRPTSVSFDWLSM